jgi:hypothetical protein
MVTVALCLCPIRYTDTTSVSYERKHTKAPTYTNSQTYNHSDLPILQYAK